MVCRGIEKFIGVWKGGVRLGDVGFVSLGEVGYGLGRYREVHRGLETMGEVGRDWLSRAWVWFEEV